jgi:hypothetical protein
MIFQNFTHAAVVFALGLFAFLILANVAIMLARILRMHSAANKIAKWLSPLSDVLRLGDFHNNNGVTGA